MLKFFYGFLILFAILFLFIFFKSDLFLFFENLKMAFWGTKNQEFSYRSLLNFKLNNISINKNSPSSTQSGLLNPSDYEYIKANIYSNYPFNNYSKIVVDGGKNLNIKVNMPVIIGSNVLLGKIVKTGNKVSVAETIFSPNWKSSVYIGKDKIKGLLEGGVNPRVNFIPAEKNIEEGAFVYNSDSRFPMGILIGKLGEKKSADIWQSFILSPIYDLNSMSEVFIISDFEILD